ncbi:hypothetical protein J4Q44_G00245800 [Coregonus suidteri]|uniref:FH2 domain-containing protein n=1 Tax=Coregonus suidteri TaxID=861788 RepID=A0AAN8LFT3_9TELE
MRNFNWDAIPRQSVLGKKNVWTSQSQRPMVDFELDTQRMEEMFSRSDTQLPLRKTGSIKKTVRGLSRSTQGLQRVLILNSKKSMNVGIFLKQFKSTLRRASLPQERASVTSPRAHSSLGKSTEQNSQSHIP